MEDTPIIFTRLRPISGDCKIVRNNSYECLGARQRPWREFINFQLWDILDKGQPIGGLTMVSSSAGRDAWMKAHLQSPCLRVLLF